MRRWSNRAVHWLAKRGERTLYRIGGLPLAIIAAFGAQDDSIPGVIRSAYADFYWHLDGVLDVVEMSAALMLFPWLVILSALWFTVQNGAVIHRRHGKRAWTQFIEQIGLSVRAGILPPWYYIYSLYEPGARTGLAQYLTRCETKLGIYQLLHRAAESPLDDKVRFAAHCMHHQLPVVPTVLSVKRGVFAGDAPTADALPRSDLFIKPVKGRGGSGAERWSYEGPGLYRRADGMALSAAEFLERLRHLSFGQAWLIQPRLRNHPAIADLSNGALTTIRALTCLDEQGRPELIAAVLRMAVGSEGTVDNFHAGGIAASIDLQTGALSAASDMGATARLGWVSRHPTTNAAIEGRVLPLWNDVRALAERAHAAFSDRIIIGWDIGITTDGAMLVEGNSGPDVDIMQRLCRRGLCEGRFGPLLAFHLAQRAAARGAARRVDRVRPLELRKTRNEPASDSAAEIGNPHAPQVFFGGPERPRALRDLLEERTAAVPCGGEILWVTYYFRDLQLAHALVDAQRRGVTVKIALEGAPRVRSANQSVIEYLRAGLGDGLRVIHHPLLAHVHEKLYCFTHPRPMALLGSFNPSGNEPEDAEIVRKIGNQDLAHNLLIGVQSEEEVKALMRHARWMHDNCNRLWRHFAPELASPVVTDHSSMWFFPRRHCPLDEWFERLTEGSRLRIVASHIRDSAIAAHLIRLAQRGVCVDVVAESTVRRVPRRIERCLREGGVRFHRARSAICMHDKFMLAEGPWGRECTFGSYNLTKTSRWLNHEILAMTSDPSLFETLGERWDYLVASRE